MSLFSNTGITCQECGHVYTIEAVGSVNADRRPDLRDAILDDTFQVIECPNCGFAFRLEPLFNYLDVGRGQWIMSLPGRQMSDYGELETEAQELFDTTYGVKTTGAAREIGDALAPRLTFGWPAVREKILIADLDLDDVVVEMVKMDLIRRMDEVPMRRGIECRLIGLDVERMQFRWLDTEDEGAVMGVSVGKELYDVIAEDTDGWAELRALLTAGPFVDMQRTYMSDGSTEDAEENYASA
ncbi:CpXC domain-containing protein [Defluviimonas salinarum]|uniref:CpXC domain-containing protein n=1 Tax=Defluviimonas salinarum TaxID=2992147 RepID=A0ABT3JAM5_9RHOB|nr:CpXC domain-containing protein [Defluviimonas salinarum]MCW3784752.1 CpXC domain-containing protein [Defluviimonas salinarum]